MFLWIRDQKWLPALYVGITCLLILGGLDVWFQGINTIYASLLLAGSVILSRALPWASVALVTIGLSVPIYFDLQPQLSQLAATIALLILAAFASRNQRLVGFGLNIVVGSAVYLWDVIALKVGDSIYGVELPTSDSKIAIAVAGFIAMIAVNANAWFMGRLLYTRINHVGTDFDKALLERQVASAQLAVAEQDRRFGIAKDVTDLLLEEVSSTMVAAESGGYAIKADPSVAPRILDNVTNGVKRAFTEIRRLSDLLAIQEAKSYALPGLRDLNNLFISYREFGYGVNFRETGEPLDLEDGAALVVYRIVFESLENTRRHAPIETGIDVDFIWTGPALQILIKDNGEETTNRAKAESAGYDLNTDQKALTERPTGPGLTSLAERVVLFEGTIEFIRVPGVGFNVSAAFPDIKKYAKAR